MRRRAVIVLACFGFSALVVVPSRAIAQTVAAAKAAATAFRVDTDVYTEETKEPVKQTLTLFKEGVYYDFAIDETQAVTVIDPLHGRIILLSPQKQKKTTLKTAQLLTYLTQARQQIANTELAAMLSAVGQVHFDPQQNKLRVGDDTLYYEATLQTPKDASMAEQYADFADWSARLNAVLPPKFPPYLRLELNRQIAERQLLPEAIYRVSTHNKHTSTLRAQLIANGRLSIEDDDKLRSVGGLLQTCKEVPVEEFFGVQPALTSNSAPPAPACAND
jgi:hypothetical protein